MPSSGSAAAPPRWWTSWCSSPVKTAQAVPKEKIVQVMAALDGVTLHAPIRTGQVVLTDVCGTGVDVVATRDL